VGRASGLLVLSNAILVLEALESQRFFFECEYEKSQTHILPGTIIPEEPKMDKRILVITQYGLGSPYAGNRARMQRLFEDLREIGYLIHLADVKMPDPELQTTLPYVDAHVMRFKRTPVKSSVLARIQVKIRASSAEFVGSIWLGKIAKLMI
jgi:hypothetical protein